MYTRSMKRKAAAMELASETERESKRSKLAAAPAAADARPSTLETKKPNTDAEVQHVRGSKRMRDEVVQDGEVGGASKHPREGNHGTNLPFLRSGKERVEPATKHYESAKRKRIETEQAGDAGRVSKRSRLSNAKAVLSYSRIRMKQFKPPLSRYEGSIKRKRTETAESGEVVRASKRFRQRDDGAGLAWLRNKKQRTQSAGKTCESSVKHKSSRAASPQADHAIAWDSEDASTAHEEHMSIPRSTLHHIAKHLTPFTADLPSADVFNQMRLYNIAGNMQRAILAPRTTKPQRNRLLRLPNELLDMILPDLEPADMVCLGLTCYEMFMKLDYQLADIQYGDTVARNAEIDFFKPKFPLLKQVFDATDRLDRDNVSRLVEGEGFISDNGKVGLTCSVCRVYHPSYLFSEVQQGKMGHERLCLAAETKVRLCDHWFADLQEVRAETRNLKINPSRVNHSKDCEHASHDRSINNPEGSVAEFNGSSGDIIAKQDFIVFSHRSHKHLSSLVPLRAQVIEQLDNLEQGGAEVCPHISINSDEVVRLFQLSEEARGTRRLDSAKRTCKDCGVRWEFGQNHTFSGGNDEVSVREGRYLRILSLRIERHVGEAAVEGPWSEEWLGLVEGGEELMDLLVNEGHGPRDDETELEEDDSGDDESPMGTERARIRTLENRMLDHIRGEH